MSSLMRVCRRLPFVLAPALLAFALGHAEGQQAPATLTLDEAIQLARRYNPDFRSQVNDQGVADWNYREQLGNLLPSVNLSSGYQYQAEGTPRIGLFSASEFGLSRTPARLGSSYNLSMNLGLSGANFFQIGQAKATRAATDARVSAASFTLQSDVTREYVSALRSRDALTVARQNVETARQNKRMADARVEAGEATRLDASLADVAMGRAEVALIQAENTYSTDRLRLMQRIGVNLDREIELTSTFEVFDPTWSQQELIAMAVTKHPQVEAARAAENAANAASKASKMQYLPSLNLGAGWSGSTSETADRNAVINSAKSRVEGQHESCLFNNRLATALPGVYTQRDCSAIVFTPQMEQEALAVNNAFPFNFTGNPLSLSAFVSFPIFDGFSREAQMQRMRAQADDAKHTRRAAELAQQTLVATAYRNVIAARRAVDIEKRGAEAAEQSLALMQERYRLGASTFVDLSTAQQTKAQADRGYVEALYAFHENVAALEAAVGQPLRR
jgi:outer membrane protein TolC